MAPLITSVVTSYDQKTKKVNEKKSNEYFNVSVKGFTREVKPFYAHIEIVVTFLVVIFFVFWS